MRSAFGVCREPLGWCRDCGSDLDPVFLPDGRHLCDNPDRLLGYGPGDAVSIEFADGWHDATVLSVDRFGPSDAVHVTVKHYVHTYELLACHVKPRATSLNIPASPESATP